MIFAYGSLVNRKTWSEVSLKFEGILPGWVRQWRHCIVTSFGKVCVLNVAPKPEKELEGLVLETRDIAALDRREIGYSQTKVSVYPHLRDREKTVDCSLYIGDEKHCRRGDREFPVWLSYLDVVLLGYSWWGGRPAIEKFVASTEDWDVPILNDRNLPKYPRSFALSREEEEIVNDILDRYGLMGNLFS